METKGLSLNLGKKPAKVIANKQTMNFAYRESTVNWKKIGIIAGVLVIVMGVFTKFAIIDMLAKKNAAIEARDSAQRRLNTVMARMAKYNELEKDFNRYTDNRMNENERFLVNRVEIFEFIEDEIMEDYLIESVSLRSNDLTLNIANCSLGELGDLVEKLQEHELVNHVTYKTTHSLDGDTGSHNIVVTLQKVQEGSVDNEEA